ncbi:hypothetical protein B0T18DRAFT_418280 [Schizothecium vesticola]|uniref:DUF726-domain-containing protein n=1 Tax=Schizothecium vesticola TaxID=314040 RepID=A0AA40JZF7_9PEZI|nr:hypothetical protein B0T18DRAFT_418280 [Schizothecium vesticola]
MGETKDGVASPDKPRPSSPADHTASTPKQPAAATGDTPSDMPPNGRQRPNTPKRDVDLSVLLTASEKTELVSFVAKVTDNMQRQIVHVFDSTGINDSAIPTRISFWSRLPAHLRDLTLGTPQKRPEARPTTALQKENRNPQIPARTTVNPATGVENPFAKAHEQSASGPRLQELKKEVLLHFKKWQGTVHKRVSDINVKRPEPQGGISSYGSRRGAPPPYSNRNRLRGESNRAFTVETDPNLTRMYPPTATTLLSMPADKRVLLLHALLLLLISLEHYSAYSRILLLNIASSLQIPLRILADDEVRVAKGLSEIARDMVPEELLQKKVEETKSAKKWKVAVASAAGAALLGATGGLAAPLVAAGIGSILGGIGLGSTAAAGLLGAMAENALLIGSIFGIYGARTTAKMMEQYTKDIQDFAFIPVHGSIGQDAEIGKVLPENRRFRIVMCVGGWLTGESDIVSPWTALGHQNEVYAVRWELEPLLKMGNALDTVIKSAAWSTAKKEIIARTSEPNSRPRLSAEITDEHGPVFASLFQALWPVGLLKISKIIDNPWNVAMVRADKTGAVLADVIMNKSQGERGVTLIGYSLGARAIYICLMILAERRVFGLVENVVMMGLPAPSDPLVWCAMKSVVSGRLVNVYSENDYLLGFLYRTSSIQFGVAGLQKVAGIDGVENVDVSAKVSGHLRYQYLVGSILKHIGWEDIDRDRVAQNEAALAVVEKQHREREHKRDSLSPAPEVVKLAEEVEEKIQIEPIRTRARKSRAKKK